MFHRHANVSLTSLTVTRVVIHARALKKEVRDLFPSVMALIRLLLLCPASSAEAERSFSSLRRLKTWLRSTMTQERLNSVAVCHIHQDLLDRIDMDAIMCDFVSRSEIRKNIFGNILAWLELWSTYYIIDCTCESQFMTHLIFCLFIQSALLHDCT